MLANAIACDISEQSNEEEDKLWLNETSSLVDTGSLTASYVPQPYAYAHNVCKVLDDLIVSSQKYFVSLIFVANQAYDNVFNTENFPI